MPETLALVKMDHRIFLPKKREHRIVGSKILYHYIIPAGICPDVASSPDCVPKSTQHIVCMVNAGKLIADAFLLIILRAGIHAAKDGYLMAFSKPPVNLMHPDRAPAADPRVPNMVIDTVEDSHWIISSSLPQLRDIFQEFHEPGLPRVLIRDSQPLFPRRWV